MLSKVSAVFASLFRSKFEAQICFDLQNSGIDFAEYYERVKIPYRVPARAATYLPDLISKDGKLVLEIKGYLGEVADRMKYIFFSESNPDIEIRFILQRAKVPIYKHSKTTQEQWLRSKGFKVAIGAIPPEWIEELTR